MEQTPGQLAHDALSTACAEARRWLGATSPNPAVGAAALAADGSILAVAAHQRAGGDHAEAALLKTCREKNLLPQIDTLCVTLEPCNHQGRTPPCTEAIIQAGIKRVVIGTRDPNHNVKGGGIERLREAGIEVICGIAEEECKQLIHAFAYHAKTGKPFVTIKRAFDRNGSMMPAAGQKTFTSPSSLRLAHRLRKKADAILTGSGTILADNPLFTVRHVPDFPGKQRWLAVLDRRGRVPETYKKSAAARGLNVVIYQDIKEALTDLEQRGARDILVEAGPALSQSLMDLDLWAMSVKIQQSDKDTVDVTFNPNAPLPFDKEKFYWDTFLPTET